MKDRLRVLIASDGSPSAERAILLAECVDWPPGTEFRIVSVLAPVPVLVASALTVEMSPLLPPAQRSRSLGGVDVEVTMREGRAASRIVDEATDWRADLVIVGSRGQGPLRAALLGSVAAEVVDHAPCAVLVAQTVCAHSVLLADDGSDTAARAAAFLVRVPSLGERELRVLSVTPVQVPLTSGVAAARASMLTRPAGTVSYDVRTGDPAEEILKESAERGTDLIVLGSHGRTGLGRALLGSVARKVLTHADCSVLIVRADRD